MTTVPTMINFGMSVLGPTIPILANRQDLHGRGTQDKKTDNDSPTIWIYFLQFESAVDNAITSARVVIVNTPVSSIQACLFLRARLFI